MTDEDSHQAVVAAWQARARPDLRAASDVVLALERAFDALWSRANATLSAVTLAAITERVLSEATELHPVLGRIWADESGLHFEDLHVVGGGETAAAEARAASSALLVGWLTVLGNLTAEVLSPVLHGELNDAEDVKP